MEYYRLYLPRHIAPRWRKFLNCDGRDFGYNVTPCLEAANVNKKEFAKCWTFVKSRTMPDEVFSWFKDAGFGQANRSHVRDAAFARKILQRYKDIEVYVSYVSSVGNCCGLGSVLVFVCVYYCENVYVSMYLSGCIFNSIVQPLDDGIVLTYIDRHFAWWHL